MNQVNIPTLRLSLILRASLYSVPAPRAPVLVKSECFPSPLISAVSSAFAF